MRRLKYASIVLVILSLAIAAVSSPVKAQADVESANLAKFVALMQYIRSQPTPSDVTAARIPVLAQFDGLFIDIYVEGFIAPFTGETTAEAKARIEALPAEDRYAAAMVESYRLASDPLLLDIMHILLAQHYVSYFTTGDLSGANEFLGKAKIQSLADTFDYAEYSISTPSATQSPGEPLPSTRTSADVESANLAKFVALMQYIRSQPTPSDVTAARIPVLAQFDGLFIDIYIEGFIAPFTGESPAEAKARIEALPAEDRYAAAMVESYRLASDSLLLDIMHILLAQHYVSYFTTGDLSGANEFLGKAKIQNLVEAFDPSDYAISVPSIPVAPVPQPDPSLALSGVAELAGYWSSGEGGVKVTLVLMDTEASRREGAHNIRIVCSHNATIVEGCGDELTVMLPGGGGLATTEAILRTPIGSVSFEIEFGGEEPLMLSLDVPERILGVEREVWECFRDEPDTLELPADDTEFFYGDCAGWGAYAGWKWNQEVPVSVWVTGLENYISTLKETLQELSPLLGLDFLWVDSPAAAALKAYVGLPASQATTFGFPEYCAEALGCAGPDRVSRKGVVENGIISVWGYENEWWTEAGLLDELTKHVTVHEALHALVPMNHREDPASIMDIRRSLSLPTLSHLDEALIRLHQHHLVEPGMTNDDIEPLIVFREDLLDSLPRELDGYELARNAFGALQEADSARFNIAGGWTGSNCNKLFGWADYGIADFDPNHANVTRFKDGNQHYFLIDSTDGSGDWEYWSEVSGQWSLVDHDVVFDNTNWRLGFSTPHQILASVLFFSESDDFSVSQDREGLITLRVTLNDAHLVLPWSGGETLDVVLTLDEDTHEMLEYNVEWTFDAPAEISCPLYTIRAVNGEYGVEVQIPDAILDGSAYMPAGSGHFHLDPRNVVSVPGWTPVNNRN